MAKEFNHRLIASLEIVTAAGLALFWIAFFIVGMAPDRPPACYYAYEHAVVLPDCLLAVLLLTAGILLMQNRPVAFKLSLAAAGALIFLGVLDFCFNIQNGIYIASSLDLVINAAGNLWCTGFGLMMAVMILRRKDA